MWSSILMLCCVLSCCVLSCRVLSCCVLACCVLSCRVLSCCVLSCCVLSCRTCLGAVSVWTPAALATMVWLFPGLGCSDSVRPETAWTRISVMETLSSVTEKADSPNTASTASGDSTCREKELCYCFSTWQRVQNRQQLYCLCAAHKARDKPILD